MSGERERAGSIFRDNEKRRSRRSCLSTGGAPLDPSVSRQVADAMRDAFVHSLTSAMRLSMVVAAVGVVLALATIELKRAPRAGRVAPAGAQDVGHPALAQAQASADR